MQRKQKSFLKRGIKLISVLLSAVVLICAFAGMSVLAQNAQGESENALVGSPDLSETVLIVLLIVLIVCGVVGSAIIIAKIWRSLPKNKSPKISEVEDDE